MPLQFPEWLQWYKKPSYVDIKEYSTALAARRASSPARRNSVDSRKSSTDIPRKLTLEKILKNEPCSPMSLYDFYMYLKHIEHSPENLEFYVWFKNFEAGRLTSLSELPRENKIVYDQSSQSSSNASLCKEHVDDKSFGSTTVAEIHDDFGLEDHVNTDEIYDQIAALVNPMCGCLAPSKTKPSKLGAIADKFRSPEAQSTTDVPSPLSTSIELRDARRAELDAITVLFLLPGSPKELNIPAPMRDKALSALQTSTSAHNIANIADHCYILLKSCSHRNFIRLGVGNGTFETVCMATSVGIVLTLAGFLCMFLLAFASPSEDKATRWRGLASWPMWFVGVSLIFSGLRGSCFFLLLFSRRQPLPWEKFDDGDDAVVVKGRLWGFFSKLMIFDRKLKVKDDNLRYLQRRIVMQSIFGGFVFATLMSILFLGVPIWKPL